MKERKELGSQDSKLYYLRLDIRNAYPSVDTAKLQVILREIIDVRKEYVIKDTFVGRVKRKVRVRCVQICFTLCLLTTDPLGFGVYGIAMSVCLCGPKNIKAFVNKMKANLKENFLRILEALNSFKAWIK